MHELQAACGEVRGMSAAEIGKIVRWAQERYPLPWQRDALRRSLRDLVGEGDVAELVEVVRSAAGLGETSVVAQGLSEATGPAVTTLACDVVLGSVHDIQHVNALAADQTIHFALKGVTAIYGENGAG